MEVETSPNSFNMQPLLKVEKLVKSYPRKNAAGSREELFALDGVSFAVAQGTTLAVVGESGSGKSTLGFCISCLEIPTSGSIWFEGRDIVVLAESERRKLRPQIQLIFQDPSNSLNPRWSVEEILFEPLNLQGKLKREEAKQRALALMTQVGLSSDMFPSRAVASVVGIGGMAGAIGGMLIANLVGHLLQWTGSYMVPFLIAGSVYLLALGFVHLLAPKLEPASVSGAM